MASVSNKQIPQCFRAYRPKWLQWLGRTVLSILGWKVSGKISEEFANQKLVVIVALIHLIGMVLLAWQHLLD